MIKKLILISVFCTLLISCGKKGDPEYNTNKNNANKHGAGKLTDKQYFTARTYNCMLGLIDTLYLIEHCVSL